MATTAATAAMTKRQLLGVPLRSDSPTAAGATSSATRFFAIAAVIATPRAIRGEVEWPVTLVSWGDALVMLIAIAGTLIGGRGGVDPYLGKGVAVDPDDEDPWGEDQSPDDEGTEDGDRAAEKFS